MSKKISDILIIDDSEADALIMQKALQGVVMENTVKILNNASHAVDYLNKKDHYKNVKTPDLILLDLNMPDFNGFDFLSIIKKDTRFSHIPVIILSGSTDQSDINRAYSLGANCFIHKPDNIGKFKQTVTIINEFWLGISQLPKKDK